MHTLPRLIQRLPAGQSIPRHRHADGYAAIVLEGTHQQAGDAGRRRLGPGEVAVHAGFAAHLNHVGPGGARLLNLPVAWLPDGFGRVDDPDELVRLAGQDPQAAAARLQEQLMPLPAGSADWPDLLAAALAADPGLSVSAWARQHGLAAATVSRGFARVFGTSPRRFRSEALARRALHGCLWEGGSLAHVALEAGFADQSHMTHAITALTGCPPGEWRRRSSGDKTAAARRGTVAG
jgi:AraC-like DNA-binding protein